MRLGGDCYHSAGLHSYVCGYDSLSKNNMKIMHALTSSSLHSFSTYQQHQQSSSLLSSTLSAAAASYYLMKMMRDG
jgi:hypothetical protein